MFSNRFERGRFLFVAVSAFSLAGAFVVYSETPSEAATLSFPIDCGNLDEAAARDAFGATLVVEAQVGDVFEFDYSNSTVGVDCQVTSLTERRVFTQANSTNRAPNKISRTVGNSGFFTIQGGAGPVFTVYVDACGLSGSGSPTDPWLVGQGDLSVVGETQGTNSCDLGGHYLQTENISGVDLDADSALRVSGGFSGTYDGDHYSISFVADNFADRDPLFQSITGGTVKKLTLSGEVKSTGNRVASLAEYMRGGLISEVESSVALESNGDEPQVGGLVAVATVEDPNTYSRIQYSRFTGSITWSSAEAEVSGPVLGGLVGRVQQADNTLEIRDSYSLAEFNYDSGDLTGNDDGTAVFAGGLVGSDGETGLSIGSARTYAASQVLIVRSYFGGSFSNTCEDTATECNIDSPSHVFTWGLIGVSEGRDDTNDGVVSSFWTSSSSTQAIGFINGGDAQPVDYTSGDPALPVAVPLTSALLQTLSTYQSEESSEQSGVPSAESDLLVASSTGTLAEQDYRWAIEQGNIGTFVPSNYTDLNDFVTRQLFSDTSVEQEYRREGSGDLSVHDGEDQRTVSGYPTLGRVWEICSGSTLPFLVWEERSCSGGATGPTSRSSSDSSSPSVAELAAAAGLTEAEYAAFIASGLTLEQFKASRLAATGPNSAALLWGLVASTLLLGLGVSLLGTGRRGRLVRRI